MKKSKVFVSIQTHSNEGQVVGSHSVTVALHSIAALKQILP
jgi:hypothetical protein